MISSLNIAALTNTGLHRRRNEDSLLVGSRVMAGVSEKIPLSLTIDSFPVILAVADGIGGSVAGDIASREVMQQLADPPCPDSEEKLRSRIISSGEFLDHLVRKNPEMEGLGTTLAGALFLAGELFIFSCGDSRVYLSPPDRQTHQLMTRDHSVVQKMIEEGRLTEKEARKHPLGHYITSCLAGGRHHYLPDIRITRAAFQNGTRLIICTDGVWDYGGEKFLKAACLGEPVSAAQEILKICYEAGAPDNISLIIADIRIVRSHPSSSPYLQ